MSQTLTYVSRGISSSDDDKDGRVNDDDETSVEESGLDGRCSTADGQHTLAVAVEDQSIESSMVTRRFKG